MHLFLSATEVVYSPKEKFQKSIELAGKKLTLETGLLARQAGSAVLVRYGDTVVLATATAAEPREGIDFFPLTVDYEERFYAVGKIPGGFIKREGRPGEKAILSARLIDRAVRPLFPKEYRREVHVVATIYSVDWDAPPDVAALMGASAALTLSEIPFAGPVGAVTVGLVEGNFVLNPSLAEAEKSTLHLVVAGTEEEVVMIEAGAEEVPEAEILEAIRQGQTEVKKVACFITEFRKEALAAGFAKPKQEVPPFVFPDWGEKIKEKAKAQMEAIAQKCLESRLSKKEREKEFEKAKEEVLAYLIQIEPEVASTDPHYERVAGEIIAIAQREVVRDFILKRKLRLDGRTWQEVRPVSGAVGLLPRTHGSALFNRGETQVMTVATLGAVSEEQVLDDLGVEETKRYMHHYNMPPYSVGEVRPIRSPGRREIGHGALAERALEPLLPPEEEFPYTIRLVSEVLSSNGSTSMASVCGSTLALMDAGVPIRAPAAGIAMGMVKEGEEVAILTDIQGIEDALGDMDFKVAGTAEGVTALQVDLKIAGISPELCAQIFAQAREARLFILEKMRAILPAPRPTLSPYAPQIICITVDPEKIREVIGSGGKTIRKIVEETGAKIDVEDDGRIFIATPDVQAAQRAIAIIEGLTKEVEIGKNYLGKVTRITDFGAFVEIIPGVLGMPGKEGLVHISQLAAGRVERVEDVVKEGEKILVKAIGFDPQGRLRLSRKEVISPSPPRQESPKSRPLRRFPPPKRP